MIRIYICFLLCLFFESSFSQSRRFYDNNDYKKQRHEINFGLGVSSCQTDVGGSQYNDQELSENFGGTIFRSLYDTDLSSSNFALNAAYVYRYSITLVSQIKDETIELPLFTNHYREFLCNIVADRGKIDAIAGSQIWTRNGTEIYSATADDLVVPNGTNATLGSAAKKWKGVYATDVYTGDLHLKNDKGDWTMIEAEEYLTIRNNKTGKTFKLMMEEV